MRKLGEGQYATVKVFATPVLPPAPASPAAGSRPGSAVARSRPTSAKRPLFGAAFGASNTCGGGGHPFSVAAAQQAAAGNAGGRRSPSSPGRRPSPTPAGAATGISDYAVLQGQALLHAAPPGATVIGGEATRTSPRQWEHWQQGPAPGRAAADAAAAREQIYNNNSSALASRVGSALSNYAMPRPSIPHAHAVLPSTGGVVHGRSFFGENAARPTSARSTGSGHSSSSRGGGAGGRGSPARGSSGLSFPPRKAITAELSALRMKFGAAAQSEHSSQSNYHHHRQQQQQQHPSPSSRPGTANYRNPKYQQQRTSAQKMKSKLDNIVQRLGHQLGGASSPGTAGGSRAHDMGTGYQHQQADLFDEQQLPSSRVPPELMPEAIARRKQETARLLRREERSEREEDKRIRNFKARALVHTASQMAQQKAGDELKEIKDKLVWARMRRAAVENELEDLRAQLASLPGSNNKPSYSSSHHDHRSALDSAGTGAA